MWDFGAQPILLMVDWTQHYWSCVGRLQLGQDPLRTGRAICRPQTIQSQNPPPPPHFSPIFSFGLRCAGFLLSRFSILSLFSVALSPLPHLLPPPPPVPPSSLSLFKSNSPQSLKMASSRLLCTSGPLCFPVLSAPTADSLTTKASLSLHSSGSSCSSKAKSLWFDSYKASLPFSKSWFLIQQKLLYIS